MSEEILPLLQSFTFYGIAIPEPTTIGQQPHTAGSNLTSAIIGRIWDLQALPPARNQQLFGYLLSETLMTVPQRNHLSSFQQLQNNLHQHHQIITAQHLLEANS